MIKPIYNLKIYAVGGHTTISNWMRGHQCSKLEEADVVVFPGGADVTPSYYGAKANYLTVNNPTLDANDNIIFERAIAAKKKMVGICRGAQFLCAKAGGILVQHQLNAHQRHPIFTFDGKIISVSSDHHQAMFPWRMKEDKYKVLGWSIGESGFHQGESPIDELVIGKVPFNMEVENAYYPDIQALCIQSHPEWQYASHGTDASSSEAIVYMRELMDRFMDNDQFKEAHNAFNI